MWSLASVLNEYGPYHPQCLLPGSSSWPHGLKSFEQNLQQEKMELLTLACFLDFCQPASAVFTMSLRVASGSVSAYFVPAALSEGTSCPPFGRTWGGFKGWCGWSWHMATGAMVNISGGSKGPGLVLGIDCSSCHIMMIPVQAFWILSCV